MTNAKYFTKAELRNEIKAAFGRYREAASQYNEMKKSTYAASFKLANISKKSKSIGFTCYYHSNQKNERFSKPELAQAWLDIMTATHEMLEEIGNAAAAKAN